MHVKTITTWPAYVDMDNLQKNKPKIGGLKIETAIDVNTTMRDKNNDESG